MEQDIWQIIGDFFCSLDWKSILGFGVFSTENYDWNCTNNRPYWECRELIINCPFNSLNFVN